MKLKYAMALYLKEDEEGKVVVVVEGLQNILTKLGSRLEVAMRV